MQEECVPGTSSISPDQPSMSKERQAFQRRGRSPKEARHPYDHILAMVNDLQVIFGKGPGGLSIPNDAEGRAPMWKNKSIFWDLPYRKDLEVRSAIDVMHVTKNLCVNLLGFLAMYGKTKDTLEAREDPQRMHGKDGIHQGRAS